MTVTVLYVTVKGANEGKVINPTRFEVQNKQANCDV